MCATCNLGNSPWAPSGLRSTSLERQVELPRRPGGVIPASGAVIPAPGGVILAPGGVIPAPGGVIPAPGGVIPAPGWSYSGARWSQGVTLMPAARRRGPRGYAIAGRSTARGGYAIAGRSTARAKGLRYSGVRGGGGGFFDTLPSLRPLLLASHSSPHTPPHTLHLLGIQCH